MPTAGPADDAAIREQAYYFWEEDGRPEGRETEYWMRATVAVTGKAQLDTLTDSAPKKAAKPKVAAKPAAKSKVTAKPAPKLKAAASKTKATPAKAEPAKKPKKK
ncbi:MAG: DUF2934 domain-containing protein [Devosia sp.]